MQLRTGVVGLSTFDGGVAVLGTQGRVSITTRGGALGRQIETGRSRAVALRRNVIVVLSDRGTLDVYSRRCRNAGSIPGPCRLRRTSLDVQFGTALLTAGKNVYAMNLATGRMAHLFHAPTRVAAQIEAPGAAIQFNQAGRGYLRFVPMSRIETSTR